MVVPPTVPARRWREFIALAKASPGQMTYGSVGVGTPQHLGAELFKMHAGVDLIHVPYRGATAAIPDLLAGRMQMFIGAINSLLPLINEGKLTALAVDREQARRLAVGCADHGRDLPRLRDRLGRRPGRAGRHAGRDRRDAAPRDRGDPRHTGLPSAHGRDRGRCARYHTGGLREDHRRRLRKWGKVVAAAGLKPE